MDPFAWQGAEEGEIGAGELSAGPLDRPASPELANFDRQPADGHEIVIPRDAIGSTSTDQRESFGGEGVVTDQVTEANDFANSVTAYGSQDCT